MQRRRKLIIQKQIGLDNLKIKVGCEGERMMEEKKDEMMMEEAPTEMNV